MTLRQLAAEPPMLPTRTSWYLADLGEARGKQELFTRQSPQKLKVLREHALIESAVSSNRISSKGWHQGKHDPWPYLNHLLFILTQACKEFEERIGRLRSPRGEKTEAVYAAIQRQISAFRVADLQDACPGVSVDMIRHLLDHLRSEGKVKCLGRGRSARWEKPVN